MRFLMPSVCLLILLTLPSSAAAQPLAEFTLGDVDLTPPFDVVPPGETYRYEAVVEASAATGSLTNAVFRLLLSPDSAIEAGTATTSQGTIVSGSSAAGTLFEVALGTLSPGSPATLSIEVKPDDPFPSCNRILVQATLLADGIPVQTSLDADGNSGSTDTDVDVSTAVGHQIFITEGTPNGFADPGELLSYRVDVQVVGDGIPDELVWRSLGLTNAALVPGTVTVNNPAAVIVGGNTAGDTVAGVEHPSPGGSEQMTIRFDALADNPLPPGATSVTLDGRFELPCFASSDTSLSLPVDGAAPELGVIKDDGGASAGAGSTVAYALTVTNAGGSATGVQLRDVVPDHTTFNATASDPGWICLGTSPGSVCTLPIGAFPGGDPPRSFQIGFDVDDPLAAGVTELVNSVVARDDGTSGSDPNPSNNLASDTTPIATTTAPDLVVTKDDGGATANAGETMVYSLTLANIGSQDASGVVLSDAVPAHTSFSASASSPGWSCAAGTCTLLAGTIAAGAPAQTFTIGFTVDDPVAAGATVISNTVAAADDGTSGPDLDPSNNQASDTTPIASTTAPDLVVTKDDGGATANAGDTIVYTLTLANTGSQDASGVVLSDAVPGHTSFSASASSPGWTCTAVFCSLSVGTVSAGAPAQVLTIGFTVDDPLAAGVAVISNTATAADDGTSGPDLDPSNNQASDITPIASTTAPDLVVRKDDGGASANAGDTIVYTLTLANTGSQDAAGVVLSDAVPAHTSFSVSASSPGWTCTAGTCSLSVGAVSAGTPVQVFTIGFMVNDPLAAGVTAISNTVIAADDGTGGGDLNPSDNVASDTTPIDASTAPDLVVAKDDGGAVANAGDTIVYTLTVSNTGSQDAAGVVLSDAVPAHASFSASASSPGWACTGGTCSLSVGAVSAGTPAQVFTIGFVVDDPLAAGVTAISNTVIVADDGTGGGDLNPSDNRASDTTPIDAATAPDLVVTKDDGGATANAGDTIVYTLTVANAGSQDATGVVLSDTVPAHTSFSASASSPGWSCTAGICSLAVGTVTAGAPAQVYTIGFTVDDPLAAGVTELTNTVIATDDGTSGGDLNPSDNQVSDTTPVDASTAPDLVVAKDDGGVTANAGETIVYTLTLTNTGSQDASGVVLSDAVPVHTSFSASASSPGWSCTAGICTLSVGTVPAGAQAQIFTIGFAVDDPLAAGVVEIANTVTATDDGTSGGDLNPSDNLASDTTPIDAATAPDLVVSKDDGGATANAGEAIVYTLTVANTGSQDATGVVLSDAVPSHTSFTASVSSPGWNCTAGTCSLLVGSVVAGAAPQSFTIAFTVDDPLAAGITEITNTVSAADDGTGGADLNSADNTASDSTPIDGTGGTGPDLAVTKDDGGVTANAGGVIVYTLTLANTGNQDATGVELRDTVPAHATFDATSSSTGWSCPGTDCILAVGGVGVGEPAQVFTIGFTVDDPLAAGISEITNTVTATDDGSGGADLNPADNTASDSTSIDGTGGTGPDLVVTKDDGGITANAGETIVYTLTLANTGNQDATGVELRDTVPAHAAFDATSSSAGWSCPGAECILVVGGVDAGEPAQTFTIGFTVDDPLAAGITEITNTVTVSDDGTGGSDLNPADNTASDSTPIDGSGGTGPDLVVTKDDGGITANAGETITYTVTVTNTGNQDASGVELVDAVPDHTSFAAGASSPGWSCTAGHCVLMVGAVGAGDPTQELTIAFTVDEPLAAGVTEITNTATAADDGSGGADLNPADNEASDSTPITGIGTGPDLVITKDDSGVTAAPGETIVYTLSVWNAGTQHAGGVVVEDVVPDHTSFEASLSDPRWMCPSVVAGTGCILELGDVEVGADPVELAFAVRLEEPLAAGVTAIFNTATVSDDGTGGDDLDPSNNSATDETPIGGPGAGPDLVISKDDGGFVGASGEPITYTLSVWNAGTQHASGVIVEDEIPAHSSFEASLSDPRWSCPQITAGTPCRLELGEVGAAPVDVALTVRVDEPLAPGVSTITNTASVEDDGSGAPDIDPSNNSSTEETPVAIGGGGNPDLSAIKTDWIASVSMPYGLEDAIVVEYLVVLHNQGDAAALAVEFFPLPDPHTRYIAGSADSLGTGVTITEISAEPPTFEVRIERIEPGEERSITFAVSLEREVAVGLDYVECQGLIRGTNFEELLTDDPDTPEPNDPTRTDLEGLFDIVEIPTVSRAGLVVLGLLLATLAVVLLRRRAQGPTDATDRSSEFPVRS